jgi:hypothetical protein
MPHSHPSLIARFFRTFFKKFVETMREGFFDKGVVVGVVLFIIGRGLITERWEFVVSITCGLCIVIMRHSFGAAYEVSKEIEQERHRAGFAPAAVSAHRLFYQPQLYVVAFMLSGLCVYGFYQVWKSGNRSESASLSATKISDSQLDEIKALDQLIAQPDEWAVREVFGTNEMTRMNLKLVHDMVGNCSKGTPNPPNPYAKDKEIMIVKALTNGHTTQVGGAVQYTGDCNTVFQVALPIAYSINTRKLQQFEASSVLPQSVIQSLKGLEGAVKTNAETLAQVEDDALKKNPDYFLEYDNPTSPFFHAVDAMYSNRFIELKPKADDVNAEVRKFLKVP